MFLDRLKARDELTAEIQPATKVFCASCGAHIFYLRRDIAVGDLVDADDFAPAADDIKQPKSYDSMVCPRCGKTFHALMGGAMKLKTNKGYLP